MIILSYGFFSPGKLEGKNTCVHFTFKKRKKKKRERSAGKLDRTRVRQERSTDQGRERSKKCVVNITELRKKPLS